MFCPNCGQQNSTENKHCHNCGAQLNNEPNSARRPPVKPAASGMNFGQSIAACLGKFATFRGRALRSEYWWFFLFTILLSWAAMIVDRTEMLAGVVNLALLIPGLAAGSRRLHDTGRSGWWQLLYLTVIGIILVVIWMASEGDLQANEYGPAPGSD